MNRKTNHRGTEGTEKRCGGLSTPFAPAGGGQGEVALRPTVPSVVAQGFIPCRGWNKVWKRRGCPSTPFAPASGGQLDAEARRMPVLPLTPSRGGQ